MFDQIFQTLMPSLIFFEVFSKGWCTAQFFHFLQGTVHITMFYQIFQFNDPRLNFLSDFSIDWSTTPWYFNV